ncbi:asparagine synthetase domain-containing protein 1-like [Tubulanus polymorphus]|uniref:asparagine synthetase domain-containing protein 1-like n=1 Tax=Tubulanus polymorphus TaxID=672921 RepID=UPI003DA1DD54
MCGIFSLLIPENDNTHSTDEILQVIRNSRLPHRGPDRQDSCNNIDASGQDGLKLFMYGCVLHFRGPLTSQPISDGKGNTLLWNGEIFGGIQIPAEQNDTKVLFEMLSHCKSDGEILEIFGLIKGPWSFIYYQAELKRIWFGRDYFGRRCLLWHRPVDNHDCFILSSIKVGSWDWEEIPVDGIYYLDSDMKVHLFPWRKCESTRVEPVHGSTVSPSELIYEKLTVPLHIHPFNRLNPTMNDLTGILECSDSENLFKSASDEMIKLADDLVNILSRAIEIRVSEQPLLCSNCLKEILSESNHCDSLNFTDSKRCDHARLAVLFSGGIDSMMIAALADRHVPPDQPIDLLNVAFQLQAKTNSFNKCTRSKQKNEDIPCDPYAVPDRLTGLSGLEELKKLNPARKWNFIEINVTVEELQKRRVNCISDLVYPLKTVLDDSIGCAIWFAARGYGLLNQEEYTSPARVVLVGMGADEQLGGYSRHRGIYQKDNWKGLIDEIEMEIDRISSRNLGRDDRIITDHARESRFPFLDEDVVSFLNSLAVWKKMNLNLPRGFGEKYLLRLAALRLGLQQTSILPKRAIQFGSRIAKIENSKEKASDVCDRLNKIACT